MNGVPATSAQGRGRGFHYPLPPAGGLQKVAEPAAARAGTAAGRGMVGEGAFPAAAPSAAIGLVAFRDELSRIGFQLQPPGRPGRRGAGDRGGGGGGGGCSIQSWPRRSARPAHKGARPLGKAMSAPQPGPWPPLQPSRRAPGELGKEPGAPGSGGQGAARAP